MVKCCLVIGNQICMARISPMDVSGTISSHTVMLFIGVDVNLSVGGCCIIHGHIMNTFSFSSNSRGFMEKYLK